MMGSGKTTIGKELSKNFSEFDYIDIDEEIEKSTQKKISEIFLRHGESFFRMLESEKIEKICIFLLTHKKIYLIISLALSKSSLSSVGQSNRLITGGSKVRILEGAPHLNND